MAQRESGADSHPSLVPLTPEARTAASGQDILVEELPELKLVVLEIPFMNWNGARGRRRVYGYSYEFASRFRQRCHLAHGGFDVRRVCVGHRLDDDRVVATDLDASDIYRRRGPSLCRAQIDVCVGHAES